MALRRMFIYEQQLLWSSCLCINDCVALIGQQMLTVFSTPIAKMDTRRNVMIILKDVIWVDFERSRF